MARVPITNLRVLVIDEDADEATSLAYLLQLIGCKTAVAFGVEMGVRLIELFRPALVILGPAAPGRDGWEAVAEVRTRSSAAAAALYVCLTADEAEATRQRCLAAGFDRFVSKPIAPALLQDILAEACGRAAELWAVEPEALERQRLATTAWREGRHHPELGVD
jgi:CheY-like chemotaxis protein